jgi:hypothetical protein
VAFSIPRDYDPLCFFAGGQFSTQNVEEPDLARWTDGQFGCALLGGLAGTSASSDRFRVKRAMEKRIDEDLEAIALALLLADC